MPGSRWHQWAMIAALLATHELCGDCAVASDPPVGVPASRGGRAPITPCIDPRAALQGPALAEGEGGKALPPAQIESTDQPLAINLATALRLADARPLIINAAQASVQVAAAQLQQANVLWLPNVYLGASYYRHDGGGVGNSGALFVNGRDQFMAGGGLTAVFATTDAIFTPLAARQVLRSRQLDVQTARNDALLDVAESYFNVQQARGRLAGAQDTADKSAALAKRVAALARELTPPMEVNRALTQLADLEQGVASAREDWRLASADLTRVLRLDPRAVVAPLEMPHLQVTLVSPQETVDALIPIGLTYRPELASQQALVQATLARIRQERLRPLIPSLVLLGDAVPAAPGGYLMGGVFGSGVNGQGNPWVGRNDVSAQLLWEMRNLGFGNRALVRERVAQQQQSLVELFRIQDLVAAETARAYAQLQSAAVRVGKAETGLKEAQTSYAGNLKGLSETTRFGDLLVLVTRPQEAVAALQQLARAYDNYFTSANDYNRAQFRLYRALGYPASILACERAPGDIHPIDATRPPQMAPVCSPEPCAGSHVNPACRR